MRTLDSYAAYYGKWSAVWEAQALLRADAVVGDPSLREAFTALVDPLRFPPAGSRATTWWRCGGSRRAWTPSGCPRGADPKMHFKLGRGGLADVEWTVQLLQMRHAGAVEALRTTRTLDALEAAVEHDLLDRADADGLSEAWRFASRARNATVQVRGKAADQLPRDARERAPWRRCCSTLRGVRHDGQRLPPGRPARRATSSTGSSGSDDQARIHQAQMKL